MNILVLTFCKLLTYLHLPGKIPRSSVAGSENTYFCHVDAIPGLLFRKAFVAGA